MRFTTKQMKQQRRLAVRRFRILARLKVLLALVVGVTGGVAFGHFVLPLILPYLTQ
jgi:hypothetical protein